MTTPSRLSGLLPHDLYECLTAQDLTPEDQHSIVDALVQIDQVSGAKILHFQCLSALLLSREDLADGIQERYLVDNSSLLVSYTKRLAFDLQREICQRDPGSRYALARREDALPGLLGSLLDDALSGDEDVQNQGGAHPDLDLYSQLALQALSVRACRPLVSNQNLHPEVLNVLLEVEDDSVRQGLAGHPRLHPEGFDQLLERGTKEVALRLSSRADLTVEQWEAMLVRDAISPSVGLKAPCSENVLEELVQRSMRVHRQGDPTWVRDLSTNWNLTGAQAEELYALGDETVNYNLVRADKLDAERFFEALSRADPEEADRLRLSAVDNKTLNAGELLQVIIDYHDVDRRLLSWRFDLPWREWGMRTPVSILRQYRPTLLEEYRADHQVPSEAWGALAENWRGSVRDLLEAHYLTSPR